MNLKKALALLLATVLLSSLLAACGGSGSSSTAAAAQSTAASSQAGDSASAAAGEIGGSLVIWEHTPQFEAPLKAVIDGFNAIYPDVEIEYQIKSDDQYYNLLATAVQAGETPDLFWTNGAATTNMPSYAAEGVLMDLTGKVDFSLFTDEMMDIASVDGTPYAVPTVEVGGLVTFYNKDIFAENGLEVPKTFADFENILATLKGADVLPISLAGSNAWCIFFHADPILTAMHNDYYQEFNAGDVLAVNDPRVVDAYDKVVEWADKGYYGEGFLGVDDGGALLTFTKGEAAMIFDGTWNVKTIQENNPDLNLGVFHVPTPDGVIPALNTPSNGFSVAADTQNPAAALAFANYFATAEAQTLWINGMGAVPGVPEVKAEDPIIDEITRFDMTSMNFYSVMTAMAAEGENPTKVWEEDQAKVMSKAMTPQEFFDELQPMMRTE